MSAPLSVLPTLSPSACTECQVVPAHPVQFLGLRWLRRLSVAAHRRQQVEPAVAVECKPHRPEFAVQPRPPHRPAAPRDPPRRSPPAAARAAGTGAVPRRGAGATAMTDRATTSARSGDGRAPDRDAWRAPHRAAATPPITCTASRRRRRAARWFRSCWPTQLPNRRVGSRSRWRMAQWTGSDSQSMNWPCAVQFHRQRHATQRLQEPR